MRVTWGRQVRLLGAVALACASVPVTGVGVAQADSVSLAPGNYGYFFAKGIDKPDPLPAEPPNLTGDHADGVSPGNLAVAAEGGAEDKVSFLYFDVFNLPVGATLDKAVVTMTLVPSSPPNDISYNAAPGLVRACKAGGSGFAEDDGTGLALAPERLCDAFSAAGKAGPAGTYQWDVTGLAQQWLAGQNDGVAFTTADTAPGTNFQVVFGAASTAKLEVTYTPAVVVDTPPPAPEDPGTALPPSPDGGFEAAPPVDLGGIEAPLVPTPEANTAPEPVVTEPVLTATRPVAVSTSLRPDAQLWLAGMGLLAALVVVSLVLGDAGGVGSSTGPARRRSRLSLALTSPERLASIRMVSHRPA